MAAISALAYSLSELLSRVNLIILFCCPSPGALFTWGRGPSVFATIISILTFDYLLGPPYFTSAVADLEYFLSFVIYAAVAVLISNLADGLRQGGTAQGERGQEHRLIRSQSGPGYGAPGGPGAAPPGASYQADLFRRTGHLSADGSEKLDVKAKTPGFEVNPKVMGVATWVLLNKRPAGRFTGTIPEARSSYFPMITADNVLGVLAINFDGPEKTLPPENQVVIDTIAHLGAMALDRIRFHQ